MLAAVALREEIFALVNIAVLANGMRFGVVNYILGAVRAFVRPICSLINVAGVACNLFGNVVAVLCKVLILHCLSPCLFVLYLLYM